MMSTRMTEFGFRCSRCIHASRTARLSASHSRTIVPAVNEELAATQVLGTQRVESDPQRTADGVPEAGSLRQRVRDVRQRAHVVHGAPAAGLPREAERAVSRGGDLPHEEMDVVEGDVAPADLHDGAHLRRDVQVAAEAQPADREALAALNVEVNDYATSVAQARQNNRQGFPVGGAYLRYMKRAINTFGNEAKAAFAKVGVLMASARRTAQALHPTNLHVNKALFPRDTIQSRLPNPEWLEHWLDTQIKFDAVWENKVIDRILHNMSLLMDRSFKSVQELNRYRKEVAAALQSANLAASAPRPA